MSKISAFDQLKLYINKAGEISRQLGFAGIAIIWFLSGQTITQSLNHNLNIALWCLIISLTLDLFQYIVGSIMWGINSHEADAATCKWTIRVSYCFIGLKLGAMLVGYIGILLFLYSSKFLAL